MGSEMCIRDSSSIAVVFRRQGETTGFSLLEKEGDVRVLMEE